jgi:hypothetical protein
MTADVKTKWTAALRSGRYRQGTGYLHRGDAFCCFGVLCDVVGLECRTDTEGITHYRFGSNDVWDWDFQAVRGDLWKSVGAAAERALIAKNDLGRESFATIADWIDANVSVTE